MLLTANRTSHNSSPRALALLAVMGSVLLAGTTTGCTTKKYVRAQTAPIIEKTNDLDAATAANHRDIGDTDSRATTGIASAQAAADTAYNKAIAAGASADQAQQAAHEAALKVENLSGTVAGLDTYKQLADVSVTFAFDKAVLTPADKKTLDTLASSLQNARGYLLEVTGGTDTSGNAQYNYQLSQRRADAVVSYLSSKYNIPPHKFYLIGVGKDAQVAGGKSAASRAANRRVEVKVMSNMTTTTAAAS